MNEREFFEQMATCREAYRRLADCIHDTMGSAAPLSAADLGCGLAYVAARLREHGWTVRPVDGSAVAAQMAEVPIITWDLTTRMPERRAFRVVICTETAEHIPESGADTLVDNCAWLARDVIVWSAAPPGQEWEGHINLRPPSYWLDKFAARGWLVSAALTERLRTLMRERHAQHEHCADNFHVLLMLIRLTHNANGRP